MKRTVALFLFLTTSIYYLDGSVNPRFDSLEKVLIATPNLDPKAKSEIYREMLISMIIIGPVADSILDIGITLARDHDLEIEESHYLYYYFEHWRGSNIAFPDSAKVMMQTLDSIAISNPKAPICQLNSLGAKILYYRKLNGRVDADNMRSISYCEKRISVLEKFREVQPNHRISEDKHLAGAYITLAQLWIDENRIDKGVSYYNKALKIPGNFLNKKIALLNLPDLYADLHDWESMKQAAIKARTASTANKYAPFADIFAILKLGKAELELNNLDEAEKLGLEGWAQIQTKRLKKYEDEMLMLLMEVYLAKEDIAKVEEYFKMPVVNRHPIYRAGKLAIMGEAYLLKNDFGRAERNCKESVDMLAGRNRLPKLIAQKRMRACGCLGRAYQGLGQNKIANQYLNEYIHYQSIFGEEYTSIISKAVNQIEIDKHEVLLNAKAEKREAIYENKLNYLKSIGGLILFFLSFLAYSFWKLSKKNKLINTQKLAIENSLTEKELLLKEIHHRVKNNLQVVSSLLRLQSNYIEDSSALAAINEGRNRVKSMALIHQDLYQEESFSGIKVRTYFNKLLKNLFDTYKVAKDDITLETNIDDVIIDVDIIIPLGLICNELVSNALKYAFDDSGGTLKISFKESPQKYELIVEDNGAGFDQDLLQGSSKSFGFQMVQAFVNKLNAEIKVESNAGTRILINIPMTANE